jgi:hypothetical protein
MDKLNKRQIIILIIAALFVVYAAYEYLIAGSTSKKLTTESGNTEIGTFVNGLKDVLVNDVGSGVDVYLITKAEANWQKNPFWDNNSYKEWILIQGAAASGTAGSKIIYSGYVDAGTTKIAIINGLEYRVGEQLEIEGYVLRRISPSKILIGSKFTGSEVEIPIQE